MSNLVLTKIPELGKPMKKTLCYTCFFKELVLEEKREKISTEVMLELLCIKRWFYIIIFTLRRKKGEEPETLFICGHCLHYDLYAFND